MISKTLVNLYIARYELLIPREQRTIIAQNKISKILDTPAFFFFDLKNPEELVIYPDTLSLM